MLGYSRRYRFGDPPQLPSGVGAFARRGGDHITATEERIARNEALFREVNERVSDVSARLEGDGEIGFLCECGDGGCREAISLPRNLYESVRSDPRQFVVVRGHEEPGAEIRLVAGERYAVVRKLGAAGRIAEATDPRRRG